MFIINDVAKRDIIFQEAFGRTYAINFGIEMQLVRESRPLTTLNHSAALNCSHNCAQFGELHVIEASFKIGFPVGSATC